MVILKNVLSFRPVACVSLKWTLMSQCCALFLVHSLSQANIFKQTKNLLKMAIMIFKIDRQQLFRLLLLFILFIIMTAIISLSGNQGCVITRHFLRKRHVLIINYSINQLKSKNLGLKCHYVYLHKPNWGRNTHF